MPFKWRQRRIAFWRLFAEGANFLSRLTRRTDRLFPCHLCSQCLARGGTSRRGREFTLRRRLAAPPGHYCEMPPKLWRCCLRTRRGAASVTVRYRDYSPAPFVVSLHAYPPAVLLTAFDMHYRSNALNIPRFTGAMASASVSSGTYEHRVRLVRHWSRLSAGEFRRTGGNCHGQAKPGPVSSPDRYLGARSPGERDKLLQPECRGN